MLTEDWAKVSCIGETAREGSNEEHQKHLHATDPCYVGVRAIKQLDVISLVDAERVDVAPKPKLALV